MPSDAPVKKKKGPPPMVFSDETRNTVTVLHANGIPHKTIARALKITEPTLRKHFRQELDQAFDDLRARMVSALTRQALNGSVNALKFWLATRCPEWRIPKDEAEALANATLERDNGEPVRIYMPSNGRDMPEDDDPPEIEGEATAA